MKKKVVVLSVNKPCEEDWEKMNEETTGRFCHKCEKTVIDFTVMSDREIARIWEQAKSKGEQLCGRMLKGQLNRPIEYEEYSSHKYFALPVLLSGTMLVNSLYLNASDGTHKSETGIEYTAQNYEKDEFEVHGRIVDEDGLPITMATIKYIEQSNNSLMRILTDSNGEFRFQTCNESFLMTIRHNDYKTEFVTYNRNNIEGLFSITLQCYYTKDWNNQLYTMEGKVVDTKGKPLGSATIRVVGTKRGANAKSDGTFIIPKLSKGVYTIEVSYVGYETNKVEVVFDAPITISVVLKLKEPLVDGYIYGALSRKVEEMVKKDDIGTVRRIKF